MVRRVVAALLVLLATVLAPFAVGAYWVQSTLMDSQQFSQTIAPLADDPRVKQVIETQTTAAIIEALDVENRLPDVLPDVVTQAIASGVNSAVSDGVDRYVNSDRFGTLWTRVGEGLQRQVVRLVEDDGTGAVSLQNGQLVLDTTEALTMVQQQLVADDIPFVGSIDVSKYGQDVVLADTPNLQIVIDALAIFLPVAKWLWLLVVVMFVAGVLLWRPRSRGLLWTGLGLALGGAITWAVLGVGQAWLSDSAPSPELGQLLTTVTETLVRFLANALLVMVAVGVGLAVAGWLGGGTRSGRRVRDAVRRTAHRVGAPWADGPVGRATARVPLLVPALRAIVILGALWWAIAADPLRPSTVFWILLTVGVLLVGIEILEGAGRDRDDQASGAMALTDPAGLGTPPLATAAAGAAGATQTMVLPDAATAPAGPAAPPAAPTSAAPPAPDAPRASAPPPSPAASSDSPGSPGPDSSAAGPPDDAPTTHA